MLEILKDQLMKRVNQWLAEIEENPEKKTIIDIAVIFEELLSANILTVNFGEDLSKKPIEMDMRGDTPGTFVRKTVPLSIALKEITDGVCIEAGFKWLNPFYQGLRKLTGKKNFTAYQRTLAENG